MGDISYYDISDDISDSQCNEIYESYLTSSQFVDMFSDWSERDKLENDWIKSRNFLDIDCSESDREINDILEGWSQGDSFSQSDIVEGWSQGDSFSQSDTSERKRKSSDSELPRYHKVRVIVANPQLNAKNNRDPSIIFRPWEDRNQSMENQFGAGNKAEPSHQE